MDPEMKPNDQGHKRSDPAAEVAVHGGDAKRPREGDRAKTVAAMDWYMDDEEEDQGPYYAYELHRKSWLRVHQSLSFEAATDYPPMMYTNVPVLPDGIGTDETMEVFYVKVTEIRGGFQWPLDVYGVVAVRDSYDGKRNYLFCRGRDDCQTLTSPQDSVLELTGPSRAILLWDEPIFEVELSVKGEGSSSSEDKILFLDYFGYNNMAYRGSASYSKTEVVSSLHSTVEVKFAHLKRSVEATIVSARITKGSANFSVRLTASTSSIGEEEESVLLDTRGRAVSVAEDGEVILQRRVVVAEALTKLFLKMKTEQLGDTAATFERNISIQAKTGLKDEFIFIMGSSTVHVLVAWSLLP